MPKVNAGFHLNRANFSLLFNQKVDLVFLLRVLVVKGVIKKLVPTGRQHLHHDVFIQITEIFRRLITQKFPVQVVFREGLIAEHQGREKPCIRQKKLKPPQVFVRRHRRRRLTRVIRRRHRPGIDEFRNQPQGCVRAFRRQHRRHRVTPRIFVELRRNRFKQQRQLAAAVDFAKVIP